MNRSTEYYEIDVLQLMRALWQRMWAILLAAVVFGGAAFTYAAYFITPLYEAEALMYVNNSSFSLGSTSFSITSSELTAAQSLVDTYIVILESRATLNEVIKETGLAYSYKELKEMISSEAVNSTEVFNIKVTSDNPREAERIANSIARILPNKIANVVEGSSVRIVDHAVMPEEKVSPNITMISIIGFFMGSIIACAIIVIKTLLDTQIHSEEYLMQTYDLPVLAVIPDLFGRGLKTGYYGSYDGAERGKELKIDENK